jgi:hypothetical protein
MKSMTGILARIERLEERRRPAAQIETKQDRDARVTAWGYRMPEVMPTDPQQAAAIMAGLRAHT